MEKQKMDGELSNRSKLLKTFTERKLPFSEVSKMTAQMRGKTPEEKEQIAAQLLEQLKAE